MEDVWYGLSWIVASFAHCSIFLDASPSSEELQHYGEGQVQGDRKQKVTVVEHRDDHQQRVRQATAQEPIKTTSISPCSKLMKR